MIIARGKTQDSRTCINRVSDSFIWIFILMLTPIMGLLSLQRKFVHDEFEAIKSAWKLFSGERIYVDFFQHHHPFLYYLLAPLFSLFGESTTVTLAARLVILLFAFATFLTTYKLARLLFNKHVAAVSVLFLFSATMFVDKVIEVRPDIPQTSFGLISIFLLFTYFSSGRLQHLIVSALALGIAFLFLQKILFLAFFLHALLAWRIVKRQLKPMALPIFSSVFFGTWASYCVYLLLTDQFSQYFFFNFDFNFAKLDQHHYQTEELIKHVTTKYNGIVLVFLIFFPWTLKNQEQWQFALLAGALLITAALYRTQYAQYYLYIIPLLAILAARGWEFLIKRQPVIALIALAIFLAGSSAVYINDIIKRQNDWQMELIDYVYNQTSEKDCVYDGNIMFNLFRNDLDFFWFSVGGGNGLDKYRRLKGYDYDVYSLIDKFKPKLISDYGIGNLHHPVIRDHYIQSDRYKDLYVRIDEPGNEPGSDSDNTAIYRDLPVSAVNPQQ